MNKCKCGSFKLSMHQRIQKNISQFCKNKNKLHSIDNNKKCFLGTKSAY